MKYKLLFIYFCFQGISALSQTWSSLGSGVNGRVETFLIDDQNQLLVGGNFSSINGSAIQGIAIWDSIQWLPFGNNATFSQFGGIFTISTFNNEIIIGGRFDSINGISIKNIARWNGTNWQPMGDGFNGSVRTLQIFNNNLYAGGTFTLSGSDTVHYFSKWNGITWGSTVSGFGFNAPVYSSLIYNNNLVIAGQFKLINNAVFGSVASWNDTTWSTIGNGFNNEVAKLRLIRDTLYACGTFTQIPQNPCNYISKFDHINWIQETYPIGNTDWVNDIIFYENDLFVCGNFDNPEDIGIINGNIYDSIGSAFGLIKTMEIYKNQLYVGGDFNSIANLNTNGIARFDNLTTEIEKIPDSQPIIIYPNPTTGQFILTFAHKEDAKFEISDCFGRICKVYSLSSQESSINVSLELLESGIYYFRIVSVSGKQFDAGKIVLNK